MSDTQVKDVASSTSATTLLLLPRMLFQAILAAGGKGGKGV